MKKVKNIHEAFFFAKFRDGPVKFARCDKRNFTSKVAAVPRNDFLYKYKVFVNAIIIINIPSKLF